MAMIYSVKWASVLWSFSAVVKYYGIPWLYVTHWFIIITYLHHTDPAVPHYRKGEWNFQRGAAATIDRPFLGWQGRFFLHDVAHYHVVHHFFTRMPFCTFVPRICDRLIYLCRFVCIDHAPEATKYLKEFLGPYYYYSDKPVFKAYWDNFTQCKFVEDEGEPFVFVDDFNVELLVQAMCCFGEIIRERPCTALLHLLRQMTPHLIW